MSSASLILESRQGSEVSAVRPTLGRRKCSCGGTPGVDGECAACREKRLGADRARPAPAPSRSESGRVLPDLAKLAVTSRAAASEGLAKAKGEQDRELAWAVAAGIEPEAEEPLAEEPEEEEPAPAEAEAPVAEPAAAAPEEPVAAEEAAPSPEEPGATKEKIEFKVVEAPPLGNEVKALCPAPRNVRVGFGVRRSTAAQRAAMGPCLWGITAPDPLRVRTRVCSDGPVWRLRVTGVTSIIRTFSRQLPGQQEPTVGRATAANFCTMVTDLDGLGTCNPGAPAGSNWYMLAAVRAHEQVHVDEWRTSMGTDWPTQKAVIEGLNVPRAAPTRSRRAASNAMRGSAAFQAAIQTGGANYPAFWGIPDPNVNTDAAERVLVAPRIRQICVHARNRGFGPAACPVCVANGIS
jgi:hypothetical protein